MIKKYPLLVFIIGALSLVAVLGPVLENVRILRERTVRVDTYDSISENASVRSVTSFSDDLVASQRKEVDIRFRVKVRSIDNNNNVFQTDIDNRGIRIELANPGVMALVVGDGTDVGYKAYICTDTLVLGRWYDVRVNIGNQSLIKVYINSINTIKVYDPAIRYSVRDIAVGAGYGRSRVFNGEISDFSLTYKLFRSHASLYWNIAWAASVIVMLLIVLIICPGSWGSCLVTPSIHGNLRPSATRLRLEIVLLTLIIGFISSVFYHYVQGYYHEHLFPYNTFLYNPFDRFNDLYNVILVTMGKDPYYAQKSQFGNYFPFTYLLAYGFFLVSEAWRLNVFLIGFISFHLYFLWKLLAGFGKNCNDGNLLLKAAVVIAMTFMSYPVLFEIDRANFENMVFVFLGLFLLFYLSKKYILSALFLSMAIAMKGFPLVFVTIFLYEKRYREIVVAAAGVIILTLVSMAFLKGGVPHSFAGLLHGLQTFNASYLAGDVGITNNSSLYGLIKYAIAGGCTFLLLFRDYYFMLCIFTFSIITLYVLYVEVELWKIVMLMCAMAILLPNISFNYKLINLALPIALFLINPIERRTDAVYAVLLALLLIPKEYYGIIKYQPVSIVLNPAILFIIVVMIIVEGYMRKYKLHIAAQA